jgi:arsenate reductase
VVRDGGLGEVEEGNELADADLARVLAQDVDELHADRITQRLGDVRHPLRVLARDVGVDDGLAAGLADGALLLGGELQIDSHLFTYINRNDRCQCNILGEVEAGGPNEERPEVLFVCVHNAGRSQMAAGLLDQMAAGRVHIRSAGSDPADRINPAVVEAMGEVGIDVSKEFPKPLTDDLVRAADVVITMGCGDACPFYPGKRYEDWTLDDPAGQNLQTVRRIRDEISERVRALLNELAPDA